MYVLGCAAAELDSVIFSSLCLPHGCPLDPHARHKTLRVGEVKGEGPRAASNTV
jgi:hypothetical protein